MNIVIADDHPFTLNGTKSFVESYGHHVVDVCTNGITAFNRINLYQPDVAILDINMSGMSGIDVLKKIHDSKLKTKVILLTLYKEKVLYEKANEYNLYGYILKEHAQSELEKCLEAIRYERKYISQFLELDLIKSRNSQRYDGVDKLSFIENKIVDLIAQQKTTKQIAELLFLSVKTVEGHRTNIIDKLGLPKEKNSLLMWAIQNVKKDAVSMPVLQFQF